jgi:hypothetical protein
MMRTRTKARIIAMVIYSLMLGMFTYAQMNPGSARAIEASSPSQEKLFFLYAQHGGLVLVFTVLKFVFILGLYELLALAVYRLMRWIRDGNEST